MENKKTNDELVTIIEVNQLTTAYMLQGVLEGANIQVFLQNELTAQLYGNCAGGIAIQVKDKDAEKARNLLIENGYNL
ncbi:MAG: DUF2007 domain-containing protein [Bacteroidales bacterium]|jgi:hypothetical protein|nr:DUF2007 domain-containing protein [Bacteroidales bacterium]